MIAKTFAPENGVKPFVIMVVAGLRRADARPVGLMGCLWRVGRVAGLRGADEGFYDCVMGTCPRGHRHMVDG
jgi:hypothetical protein